jgi:ABC-type antimicrobial peptide transport system permease subunit
MRAVRARLRVELRSRWRAWLVLALFVGFAGGVVLTATAGARRTASAYSRFLRASHGADLLVSPDQTGFPHLYQELDRLPGATVTPVIGYGAAPVRTPDSPILLNASPDGRLGFGVERPKITAGRLPRLSEVSEVLADSTSARLLHLHPGSRLHVRIASRNEELPSRRDPEVTLHVVGIGVTRDNVVSVNALATAPTLLATPAFTHRFGPDHHAFDGAEVRLAPGASKAAFSAAAQAIARRLPETGGNLQVADEGDQAGQVNHAIRPQAVALALFAALTALAALFAIGQLLARQVFLVSDDNGTLRALGMSRRQLAATSLAQVAATAVAGAIVAVVIAIVASPTMPIGPARVAEPHPGISLDGAVLGLGFVAIIVVSLLCAAWPAWRYAGGVDEQTLQRGTVRRPSVLRRWATAAGAPPTMAIGIGHALEPGRGRSAVPSRTTIGVTAMAVVAIAAVATFGTNLSRLVHTPRLYGQSWDVTIDSQFSPLPTVQMDALLRKLPGVTAWTYGTHTDVDVGRQIIPAVALVSSRHGVIAPTVVSGRAAVGSREVVFGTKTLEHIHRHVGQTVSASQPNPGTATPPTEQMHIVGRSVFPFFGMGSFTPTGLGAGAQVTEPMPAANAPGPPISIVLVRVAPGASHAANVAGVFRGFQREHICGVYNQCSITTTSRPTDILNYSRIRATPAALAAVLALLAIGVVANLLVTSIRRRRHDLAILKTLGIGRRGISATVAWQATTLVGVALLFGLPIGVAVGRQIWSVFADGLGIPNAPKTPARALLLAIPAALLIGNVIAAIPAYFAGRTAPAQVLRTE